MKKKVIIEKRSKAKSLPTTVLEERPTKTHHFFRSIKPSLWFVLGIIIGLFFVISFFYISFKRVYGNGVYPGVSINGVSMTGKTELQVEKYFKDLNSKIPDSTITFSAATMSASLSAKTLGVGYDTVTLARQALSVGRSEDPISNISIIIQAYLRGIQLSPTYTFDTQKFDMALVPLQGASHIDPQNGEFTMGNNRVTAFQLSKNGQDADIQALHADMNRILPILVESAKPQKMNFVATLIPTKPKVASAINSYGITELVASGSSLFLGSASERIYNINLAASRLNGVLIPPGQVFSFVKNVGDISADTGYKQAYVIENGHTVLGDGGGVCQVSTTLFRAALNAGLPIVERNPHAYRVHYYEEDTPVGIDAAVYSPTVDLKFRNDTPGYLLVQTEIDLDNLTLKFNLYGQKDNRVVKVDHPVLLSTSPAPPPLNQDDPTLPKGQVKQIDFAADGANVYFTREVFKDGKQIIADKFISNYRPWQAVYLHGTKS